MSNRPERWIIPRFGQRQCLQTLAVQVRDIKQGLDGETLAISGSSEALSATLA